MNIIKGKNFTYISILTMAIGLFSGYAPSAYPQAKDTENTADKNLKSSARINPSTLAMEFSLPLGIYAGRNGSSIPVSYSYSSKLWQMEMFRTWMWNSSTTMDLNAIFAKNTAAGWTSSLQPLRLKEAFEIYDDGGFKFTPTYATFMQMPEQPLEYNASQGASILDYHCFRSCVNVEGEPPECDHYCEPTLIPRSFDTPPENNTENLWHLVKRFHVIMPDGSSVEFRKDDNIYVLCDSNNPPTPGCLTSLYQNTQGTYLSVDGSARRLEVGELQANGQYRNALYLPNGGRYLFSQSNASAMPFERPAEKFIDINGNQISYDYTGTQSEKKVVDTLNREIRDYLPLNGITQNQSVGVQTFNLNGLNGQPQIYSLKWEQLKDPGCDATTTTSCGNSVLENNAQELLYRGGDSCVGNQNQTFSPSLFQKYDYAERVCARHTSDTAGRFNPVVLSGITLPNGTKYKFKYNVYGEITRIDYPTGGYERFRYNKIPALGYGAEPTYDQTNRGVVERWISFDGVTEEQHFLYEATGSTQTTTAPYIVRSTSPDGSYTERYLNYSASTAFGFSSLLSGMPYDEKAFDANGNLYSRTLTEWTTKNVDNGLTTASRDPKVNRRVSIVIENNLALAALNKNEYDENGSSDPAYFSHLNVRKSKSYYYRVLDLNTAKTANLTTIAALFSESDLASVSETDYSYDPGYKARNIIGLPTETRVLNPTNPSDVLAKSQAVYDEAAYFDNSYTTTNWVDPGSTLRGNATTARTWNKDTNTWLETYTKFDNFGNVRKVWDASNDPSKFAETQYDPLYKYAYPTQVIAPAPATASNDPHSTNQTSTLETTYDFTTGLPLSVKDDFGQITRTEYDGSLRPTRVFADNFTAPESQTIYGIPNASGQLPPDQRFVKVRKQIDAVNWDEAVTWFDGLGRTIKTQAKDSQGDVFGETKYDNFGRVERVTSPYRLGDTVYWSKTRYDAAGRAVESYAPAELANLGSAASLGVTSFDISTTPNFVGTVVTTTDASGRKGRSITNALGQLLRVDEPTATGGTIDADLGTLATPLQPTFYKYDAYGKMVQVTQGVQNRYFKYDSLGRLIRVRQPEQEINSSLNLADNYNTSGQWTAGFTYDVLGNVITATDAKGTVITNAYDKANRVTTRSYNDGTTPTVNFYYDGKGLASLQSPYNFAKGKLTKVTSSVSETQNTLFDNFGRITETKQITDGNTYTSKYTYNLTGALVEEEYPSGRKAKNEFECDGDLARIYGKATANATERTYANSFTYTPDGKIERLRLGNGLWEAAKFNTRLQTTEIALGHGVASGDLWKLNYEYGELNTDGTVNSAKNTGNIAKQTVSFNGLAQPFVQSYKYDSLYRLSEAKETAGTASNAPQTWKENFTYDRFGNRLTHDKFSGTTQIPQTTITHPTIDATSNRFAASQNFGYDKNGNLIADAESRAFTFSGDNKQTKVMQNGQLVGEYFFDGEGKRVKKKAYSSGQITEETIFVYSSGKMIAEYSTKPPPSNATTRYTATDQLGSPRVITNSLGEVVSRRDFMPFGEQVFSDSTYRPTNLKYNSGDDLRQKFTGYQKDEETQLDFAEARMYENRHGRFTAVDPLLASGKSANPQSFNRYVYVLNNPIVLTDPLGLQAATRLEPCQKGPTCGDYTQTESQRKSKTVTATGTAWVDIVADAIDSVVETVQSTLQTTFQQETQRAYSELSSSDPLENANFGRLQTRLNLLGGFDDGGFSERLVGNQGPTVDSVLQQTTDRYRFAQTIGEANLAFQSFYTIGTSGYLRGYQFSKGVSTGNMNFGGRQSSTSNETTTIIGETMTRVEAAAARTLGSRTFSGVPLSGNSDQRTSQLMTANRQWFLNEMRTTGMVRDIGRDRNRITPSIFYNMEQNMLKNYLQIHPGAF